MIGHTEGYAGRYPRCRGIEKKVHVVPDRLLLPSSPGAHYKSTTDN